MIFDIHSHILPNVDDGAKTIEESIQLLTDMKSQGITDVIATPHFYPQNESLENFSERINKAFEELKAAAQDMELPNIYLGCEMLYFIGIGNSNALKNFTLLNSDYLLIEFSDYSINKYLFNDLDKLSRKGIKPIIAHPERYYKLRNYKKLISYIKKNNILTQINASSLYLPLYKREVEKLLKNDCVSFIATDTHSVDLRPPMIDKALCDIKNKFGNEKYEKLLKNGKWLLDEVTKSNKELKSKTLEVVNNGDLTYITFPKLTATGIVKHAFSTRLGGVSKGRYSTMNLSFTNGDSRENVLDNYHRLCNEIEIDINHIVMSRQTHTNNVRNVGAADCGTGIFKESFSDVDGLITNESGVALVTQYADCTPLLFCDPVKKVIASSHAGWRGTVKEIGAVTVRKMINEYGCDKDNIISCIGPCIGQCCYEVDTPVYREFEKLSYLNLQDIFIPKQNGKYMLNLVEANRQILIAAGIKPENMDVSDICTCCNCDTLHSHRATNGERGNLAAIIELI